MSISPMQRRNFCRYYLLLGNPIEAAIQAGFPSQTAATDALALLQTSSCRAELTKLATQPALPLQHLVLAGLTRLAFGSAKDAVKLVFAEELPTQTELERLDLFQVSELKRIKGGGIEIKLFDRQRALERLLECAAGVDSAAAANALLTALGTPQDATASATDDTP